MEEDLLEVNNIKLVNKSHNNIRRQITNVMNNYNQIPKKNNNNSHIYAISSQIKNANTIKKTILNTITKHGKNPLFNTVRNQWLNRLKTIDIQLEDLNNRLVQAKANKNKHTEARKNSKVKQINLTRRLRSIPHVIQYNSGKENEIRYGGKHHKTHKRKTNKRNKTKRNRN